MITSNLYLNKKGHEHVKVNTPYQDIFKLLDEIDVREVGFFSSIHFKCDYSKITDELLSDFHNDIKIPMNKFQGNNFYFSCFIEFFKHYSVCVIFIVWKRFFPIPSKIF